MELKAPFITEKVEDVRSLFSLIRNKNSEASEEDIFKFIEDNENICFQSVEEFKENLEQNINLMTRSLQLKNRSEDEIIAQLNKLKIYEGKSNFISIEVIKSINKPLKQDKKEGNR